MEEFAEYISEHHRGTGISSVHRRFKKVILAGVEDGLFSENPCKGIVLDNKEDMLVKDILSAEELQQLFSTPYTWKYPDIRRAFAMTCFSGIRFCDVEALTYGDVDFANRIISFRQKKTVGHSHKSGVVMPLNDTLMAIVGEMPKDATSETRIFKLPPNNGGDNCNHFLKQWTKAAGITKHITWHCGRHSFGTQLLSNGANIKVVADLLGHSSLKYVQVYTRAVDELKKKIGIKKSIKDYGIDEKEFLERLDDMTEQAFDDQCTGANPRYPLMSEIKQMYLNAYYGKHTEV